MILEIEGLVIFDMDDVVERRCAPPAFGPLGRRDDPRCSECGRDHVTTGSPDWGVPSLCTVNAYRKEFPGALERAEWEMSATFRHLSTMRRRRERRWIRRNLPGTIATRFLNDNGVRLFPHLKGRARSA